MDIYSAGNGSDRSLKKGIDMEKYTNESIKELVEKQRSFFNTGKTLDIEFRIRQLKRLKKAVLMHEEELTGALSEDL